MERERLGPTETLIWRSESDPTLRSQFLCVVFLDRAPDRVRLRDALYELCAALPRMAQRLVATPLRPEGARWIRDDEFRLDDHLTYERVAPGAGQAEIFGRLADRFHEPFAAHRPPWDVLVLEGLADGGAAFAARAHHTMTDGIGGMRSLDMLTEESGPTRTATELGHRNPSGLPSPGDLFRFGRRFLRPSQAAAATQESLDMAASIAGQLRLSRRPRSELFAGASSDSFLAGFSIDDARNRARALGGSRNDLLVAGVVGAVGIYHQQFGGPLAEVRLAHPIVPSGSSSGTPNRFVPVQVDVPTEPKELALRLPLVRDRIARARREPAVRAAHPIAGIATLLPAPILKQLVRTQTDGIDVTATTVPGLHGPRTIAGAAVTAVFPIGPRLRCPFNVTGVTNGDRLDLGVHLDPATITDPGAFMDCLAEAFEATD